MFNNHNRIETRTKTWNLPQTVEAIEGWVENYRDKLAGGWKPPEEFTVSPVPFCIRVKVGFRVVAEWRAKGERKASA